MKIRYAAVAGALLLAGCNSTAPNSTPPAPPPSADNSATVPSPISTNHPPAPTPTVAPGGGLAYSEALRDIRFGNSDGSPMTCQQMEQDLETSFNNPDGSQFTQSEADSVINDAGGSC